jgi:hypothetical protein
VSDEGVSASETHRRAEWLGDGTARRKRKGKAKEEAKKKRKRSSKKVKKSRVSAGERVRL